MISDLHFAMGFCIYIFVPTNNKLLYVLQGYYHFWSTIRYKIDGFLISYYILECYGHVTLSTTILLKAKTCLHIYWIPKLMVQFYTTFRLKTVPRSVTTDGHGLKLEKRKSFNALLANITIIVSARWWNLFHIFFISLNEAFYEWVKTLSNDLSTE